MDYSRCEDIHEPVNHLPSKHAPKPSEPAAQEETSTSAVGVFPGKSLCIPSGTSAITANRNGTDKADRVVLLPEAAQQVNHTINMM